MFLIVLSARGDRHVLLTCFHRYVIDPSYRLFLSTVSRRYVNGLANGLALPTCYRLSFMLSAYLSKRFYRRVIGVVFKLSAYLSRRFYRRVIGL